MFAEPTTEMRTTSTDLAPVISVDMVSRLANSIDGLREVLGVTEFKTLAEGATVKTYKLTKNRKSTTVAEGAEIPLSKYSRTLDKTITVSLKKARTEVTAEAIQQYGRDVAINMRDEEFVLDTQYEILDAFYDKLTSSGTTTKVTVDSFQKALSSSWAKIRSTLARKNATPIYFVSTDDVAEYLGGANITMQTQYGMSYIENFLGLGTVIVTPELSAGKVYATAKENINGIRVPVGGGAIGDVFGMTADSTGIIGMKHFVDNKTLTLNTLLVYGVVFYPELTDAVVEVTITKPAAPDAGGTGGTQQGS